MKNNNYFPAFCMIAVLALVVLACNFSTANLSSLKVGKDKEIKTEAAEFKTGETLYAKADVANNPDKVKVKLYMVAEDAKGIAKGETLKGSEVTLEIPGDGYASYSLPVSPGIPGGKYKLHADMMNDAGEKKDSKTADVTIKQDAPMNAPVTDMPSDTDPDTIPPPAP